MRRGEIAITVIIVIALGLIVLAILGVLISTSGGRLGSVTSACEDTYKGTCMGRDACRENPRGQVVDVPCGNDVIYEEDGDWSVWSFPRGGAVCCVTR